MMDQSPHDARSREEKPRFRRLGALAPADIVQCRVALPSSALARIHAIKQRFHIRTRDAAIAALIRCARNHYAVDDFGLPREPASDDKIVSISLPLEAGHVAFLYMLQRRFRGCALGATLEAVVETVGDLRPRPVQLDFFTAPSAS